jgi:hypothetical protein
MLKTKARIKEERQKKKKEKKERSRILVRTDWR